MGAVADAVPTTDDKRGSAKDSSPTRATRWVQLALPTESVHAIASSGTAAQAERTWQRKRPASASLPAAELPEFMLEVRRRARKWLQGQRAALVQKQQDGLEEEVELKTKEYMMSFAMTSSSAALSSRFAGKVEGMARAAVQRRLAREHCAAELEEWDLGKVLEKQAELLASELQGRCKQGERAAEGEAGSGEEGQQEGEAAAAMAHLTLRMKQLTAANVRSVCWRDRMLVGETDAERAEASTHWQLRQGSLMASSTQAGRLGLGASADRKPASKSEAPAKMRQRLKELKAVNAKNRLLQVSATALSEDQKKEDKQKQRGKSGMLQREAESTERLAIGINKWMVSAKDAVTGTTTTEGEQARKPAQDAFQAACAEAGVQPLPHVMAQLGQPILHASNQPLGRAGAQALAKALPLVPQLSELFLNRTDIDRDGLAAILQQARAHRVQALDLSHISIPHQHCHLILDALLRPTQLLQRPAPTWWLSLTRLNLSGTGIGDQGLSKISSGLFGLQRLKSLDLSKTGLTNLSGPCICNILRTNTTLEQLFLSWNKMGESAAKAIAEGLPSAQKLTQLDLSWNRLGTGFHVLIWALASSQQAPLSHLRFAGCNIRMQEWVALACLLRMGRLPNLQLLDLSQNSVSGVSGQCVLQQLRSRLLSEGHGGYPDAPPSTTVPARTAPEHQPGACSGSKPDAKLRGGTGQKHLRVLMLNCSVVGTEPPPGAAKASSTDGAESRRELRERPPVLKTDELPGMGQRFGLDLSTEEGFSTAVVLYEHALLGRKQGFNPWASVQYNGKLFWYNARRVLHDFEGGFITTGEKPSLPSHGHLILDIVMLPPELCPWELKGGRLAISS